MAWRGLISEGGIPIKRIRMHILYVHPYTVCGTVIECVCVFFGNCSTLPDQWLRLERWPFSYESRHNSGHGSGCGDGGRKARTTQADGLSTVLNALVVVDRLAALPSTECHGLGCGLYDDRGHSTVCVSFVRRCSTDVNRQTDGRGLPS